MKKTIFCIVCCALFVSCAGPKGETGAQGPAGPSGPELPGLYFIRIFQQGVYSPLYAGQVQTSMRDTYTGPVYTNAANPLGVGDDGATGRFRTIIKFDISTLPRTKIIVDKAELTIRTNSVSVNGGASGVTLHKVTKTWTMFEAGYGQKEVNSVWNEPGGDFEATTMTTSASYNLAPDSTITIGLDPEVVRDWMMNPEANYGVLMKSGNEFVHNYSEIYSSGALDSSKRPMLKIWYYTTE